MKEKIKLSDIHNHDYPEDWLEDFKLVFHKSTDFDAEKGFNTYEAVIQRLTDNKFFKFEYTQFGYHGSDLLEQTAYEVEQKTKVVNYYE